MGELNNGWINAKHTEKNNFKTWKCSQVRAWLCGIGLEDYCSFFGRIDGRRLAGVTSTFLDSIGMLDVDRTVFYMELQRLYGKRVKLALVKPKIPARKVVTITESTHVVYRQDGTLVVKTGPEIRKVQIIQSKSTEQPIDKDYHAKVPRRILAISRKPAAKISLERCKRSSRTSLPHHQTRLLS